MDATKKFCFLFDLFKLRFVSQNSIILCKGIFPYDMISTALVIPEDKEELALTLNGRKNKIVRSDFISAFNNAQLDEKQQWNIFKKMEACKSDWLSFIDISFLSKEFKIKYKEVIHQRFHVVYGAEHSGKT